MYLYSIIFVFVFGLYFTCIVLYLYFCICEHLTNTSRQIWIWNTESTNIKKEFKCGHLNFGRIHPDMETRRQRWIWNTKSSNIKKSSDCDRTNAKNRITVSQIHRVRVERAIKFMIHKSCCIVSLAQNVSKSRGLLLYFCSECFCRFGFLFFSRFKLLLATDTLTAQGFRE